MPLKCAIPAFEALLPDDHDSRALDLLFTFAYWHSLAKLRLHTDTTLSILDEWTSILGHECRRFASETCDVIHTKELQREYESRKRREARKKATKKGTQPKESVPTIDDASFDRPTSSARVTNSGGSIDMFS